MSMMKKLKTLVLVMSAGFYSASVYASGVFIELEIPAVNTPKYRNPYVAVWIEKPGERKALTTLSAWYEDKKWLKDIRRWWRKAGRYALIPDGVTGATPKPGRHSIHWDGKDAKGKPLEAGDYMLYLEAVREHGDRTLLKQQITLGHGLQQYSLEAGDELGPVSITVKEKAHY